VFVEGNQNRHQLYQSVDILRVIFVSYVKESVFNQIVQAGETLKCVMIKNFGVPVRLFFGRAKSLDFLL
jgi:hypothetical protein